MMNKKADLSMNMIIIAAISLLVLAIVAYLIFGTSGKVTTGTGCEGVGGQCLTDCNNEYPTPNIAFDATCKDSTGGPKCCIKLGSSS